MSSIQDYVVNTRKFRKQASAQVQLLFDKFAGVHEPVVKAGELQQEELAARWSNER